MIGQDWYNLLNRCLNTQRQPHARPCCVPGSMLPLTNDVITPSFASLGYWVLDILDKFSNKVMKIFHRNETPIKIQLALQSLLQMLEKIKS